MVAPDGPEPIEITITADEAGERLDRILGARDLGLSRSALQRLIGNGRVELDGETVRASARPKQGARVVVRPAPAPPTAVVPQDIPIDWLHRDAHLGILHKPAGMVVHPAPGHPDGTLANALRFHFAGDADGDVDRPGIVHRLDMDTSGVMVVARSERAREGLVAAFAAHDIEREYVAIALGYPDERVTLDTLHGRHPHDRKRFSTRVDRGKRAVTHVEVVRRLHASALVRCRLETGRTHQIRVHLAEHGHPVLADPLYGRASRDPRVKQAGAELGRQALHARLLGFEHPVTGERMRFEADPPDDFERALRVLSEG